MLTGAVVTLGNVSYGSFPTANTLVGLSTNLVLSFIDFVRTIGINDRGQMADMFKSPTEDIEHLCLKCHLHPEANKKESIEHRVEMRKAWQHKVLKGSTQRFEVNLEEVLERTRRRSRFYKIDAFSKEVGYYLTSLLKHTSSSDRIKSIIDLDLVDQIFTNCHLDLIRSWKKARENPEYVRSLLVENFPLTPASVIATYLFTIDNPSPQEITNFCLAHSIYRKPVSTTSRYEEEVAFAKWVGYDTNKFMIERAEKDRTWQNYI